MRGSAGAPVSAARRSAWTPAQTTTCAASRAPARGLEARHPVPPGEPVHAVAQEHLAAGRAHVVGERPRDEREVDHGGLGRVERTETGHVRLELPEAGAVDELHARDPVLERASVEVIQAGQLLLGRRDHELPAAENGDPPLLAIGEQPLRAVDAERRLQRPGRVVDAAVHHAARAAGLVRADPVLLVDDREPDVGPPRRPLARARQTDDPRADDHDVEPGHGPARCSCTRAPSRPLAA